MVFLWLLKVFWGFGECIICFVHWIMKEFSAKRPFSTYFLWEIKFRNEKKTENEFQGAANTAQKPPKGTQKGNETLWSAIASLGRGHGEDFPLLAGLTPSRRNHWQDNPGQGLKGVYGLDLTWLDLTWLDLTWLDSTWLDLTWLDLTQLDLTWLKIAFWSFKRKWKWVIFGALMLQNRNREEVKLQACFWINFLMTSWEVFWLILIMLFSREHAGTLYFTTHHACRHFGADTSVDSFEIVFSTLFSPLSF